MEESEAAMVEVKTISGGENVLKIKSLDEWDRSDTLEFIESYHGLPVLWQSDHPFFKDKHAKQTALEMLVVKTKERFPAITIMDVKTKINTIRTQFRREMKAIATSQRIYGSKPKLWCFSQLSFLMEQEDEQAFSLAGASMDDSNIDLDLITMQVKSEIQEVDIGPNIPVHATLHESENSEDTYYDNQDFKFPKKRRIVHPQPVVRNDSNQHRILCKTTSPNCNVMSSSAKSITTSSLPPHSEQDECADFAKVVSNDLRSMGDTQRKIAKYIISQALYMGSMEILEPSAKIINKNDNDV